MKRSLAWHTGVMAVGLGLVVVGCKKEEPRVLPPRASAGTTTELPPVSSQPASPRGLPAQPPQTPTTERPTNVRPTTQPATAPASALPGDFTIAAEDMCADLFQRPIESIARSRIITGEGMTGAVDCSRVEYRPFALQTFGSRETAPRLQGLSITAGGQPQIVFSREDLTHGLLNQACWGIIGYAPQSARDVLANILQHAMSGVK